MTMQRAGSLGTFTLVKLGFEQTCKCATNSSTPTAPYRLGMQLQDQAWTNNFFGRDESSLQHNLGFSCIFGFRGLVCTTLPLASSTSVWKLAALVHHFNKQLAPELCSFVPQLAVLSKWLKLTAVGKALQYQHLAAGLTKDFIIPHFRHKNCSQDAYYSTAGMQPPALIASYTTSNPACIRRTTWCSTGCDWVICSCNQM